MPKNKIKILFVILILTAFIGGILLPILVQWIGSSGRNLIHIQGADEYFIALVWGAALSLIILMFQIPWNIKKHYLLLWGLRCFVTLFIMLFYENYYSLDAYEYYKNIMLQHFFEQAAWAGGTNFIIKFGVFLDNNFPFGRSYHAFKVVWSFIGFLAIIPLYNIYKEFVNHRDNVLVLWVLGAFPSLVFWTSILGKDPIAALGIAWAAYGLLRMCTKIDLSGFLYSVGGLYLLSFVRFWLAAIFLLPALLSFIWSKSVNKVWRLAGVLLCGSGLTYLIFNIKNVLILTTAADAFESLNYFSSAWARGGSGLEAPSFSSTSDILMFLPLGIFTAMFRPLPGEVNNIFGIIAGLESLSIIFIFIYSIKTMKMSMWSNATVTYCWSAILVWSSFYAFISYQNLGTAVRFRAQILPFLLLLPFILTSIKSQNKNIELEKEKS